VGHAALLERRFADAVERFGRAQSLFEAAGDTIGVAIALNNQGIALRRDRSGTSADLHARQHRAEVQLTEALRLRRTLGDQRGLAETLINLGVLAFERGEFVDSWTRYREALTYERLLDNRNGIGVALANLGEVAGIQGDPALGARLLIAAETVLADIGSPLASDVQAMREALDVTAAWGAAEVAAARQTLKPMDPDARCDWALSESSL
jgi:hypothetical protein